MNEGLRSDREALRKDWEAVGGFFSEALLQVAAELGGAEYSAQIAELVDGDPTSGPFPSPDALKALETEYPDSVAKVMDRMTLLQKQAHAKERSELSRNDS